MSRRVNPTSVTVILTSAYNLNPTIEEQKESSTEYILMDTYDPRVKALQDLIIIRGLDNVFTKSTFFGFLNGIKSDLDGSYNNNVNYSAHLKNHKPILNSFDALIYFLSVYSRSISDLEFKFVDQIELEGVEIGNNYIPANVIIKDCKIDLINNFSKQDIKDVLKLVDTHIGHCVEKYTNYYYIKNIDLLDLVGDLNLMASGAPNLLYEKFLSCIPSGLKHIGKTTLVHGNFKEVSESEINILNEMNDYDNTENRYGGREGERQYLSTS